MERYSHRRSVNGFSLYPWETYSFSFLVFSVCDYCRRHIDIYNHNMFRADNREAVEMRQRSTLEAMEDATQWLKSDGQVAVSLEK